MNPDMLADLFKTFFESLNYAKERKLSDTHADLFAHAVLVAEASKKADAPAGPDLVVKPVPLVSKTPMVQPAVVKDSAPITDMKKCPRCHNMIPKWFKYHQDCGWTE